MSRTLSSLLAIFFLLICAARDSSAASYLVIAGAADLTDLEPVLEHSFRQVHPNVPVKWVTSASGVLKQQIENGAPYDLFLSANAQYVDQLAESGRVVPASVVSYAAGRLGVLWRDGKAHSLKDLSRSPVRFVALPNPKLAPYGVAAVESLKHEDLWPEVQPKIVYGENVRQTLELFRSGNADVVITSDSLLQGTGGVFLIPDDWHAPIVQKAGMVANTAHQAVAREFLNFLTGPEGQAVFARFGFAAAPVARPR